MNPPKKKNEIISFLLRAFFSVLFIVIVFSVVKIDVNKIKEILIGADPGFLLLSFLIFAGLHVLLVFRWKIFIRVIDFNVPFLPLARYFFLGLCASLLNPIAMDVVKVFILTRRKIEASKAIASVALDRMSGFAGIVVVALVAYAGGFPYHKETTLIIPMLILSAVSLAVAAVLFNEKIYTIAANIFSFWPKFKEVLMSIHYDAALLKSHKLEGVKGVGISSANQVFLSVTFFLTALALHQEIPLIYFLIFVPLICVSSSIPSIAGLGVREMGAAYLFAKVGVDSNVAVSIAFVNSVFTIVMSLLGGLFYLVTSKTEK